MPKTKNFKVKAKPDIFKIYKRQKMGSDAQTKQLTSEIFTNITCSDKKQAIAWINNNGDHGNVYVIRNRKNEMITSYCWKKSKMWVPINASNYLGGYKIGKPANIVCSPCNGFCSYCSRPCVDPNNHPSCNKILGD